MRISPNVLMQNKGITSLTLISHKIHLPSMAPPCSQISLTTLWLYWVCMKKKDQHKQRKNVPRWLSEDASSWKNSVKGVHNWKWLFPHQFFWSQSNIWSFPCTQHSIILDRGATAERVENLLFIPSHWVTRRGLPLFFLSFKGVISILFYAKK